MNSPFFSIIIPTRNRYTTLKYAVLTVLRQNFTSYELIISDNSDSVNYSKIETIDDLLKDEKIKYYRPKTVLSMSDHWEFAVSKSIGKYIIIFGDDDGLVVNGLQKIYDIIQKAKVGLVSWARVEYSWPDRRPKELANLTIMPIAAKTGLINGERYIKEIIYNRGDYRYLPMLYNSAVSRELIEKLKSKTGRVFNAISPDIYSGYAFAYLSKKYLSVGYPLTINGVSSASNGAAHTNSDEKIKADFRNLHTVSEIQWPRNLPDFYTSYIGIIEPFIQLSTFLPDLKKYISLKGVYKIIIDSLESVDEKDLETKLQKITESSRHDVNLFKWVKSYINKTKPVHKPVVIIKLNERIGFDGSHLILDASDFGVKNVDDMSIFINKMFGNIKDQIFLKPVRRNLVARLKRAAGIIIKGQ